MSDTDYQQVIARRSRRDLAVRMKLGVSVLTTFGYSIVGAGLFEPLFKNGKFGVAHLGALGVGAILFYAAFHIAPRGEMP